MSAGKVWIEWGEFLEFLQKNRHLLPMPVTFSVESLDGFLKINEELKQLREALRGIVQWSDACWTGGYAGNQAHPAWEDVQEGRAVLEKKGEKE
jgi:hypothetical protein